MESQYQDEQQSTVVIFTGLWCTVSLLCLFAFGRDDLDRAPQYVLCIAASGLWAVVLMLLAAGFHYMRKRTLYMLVVTHFAGLLVVSRITVAAAQVLVLRDHTSTMPAVWEVMANVPERGSVREFLTNLMLQNVMHQNHLLVFIMTNLLAVAGCNLCTLGAIVLTPVVYIGVVMRVRPNAQIDLAFVALLVLATVFHIGINLWIAFSRRTQFKLNRALKKV